MTLDSETQRYLEHCRDELPEALDEQHVAFGFDGVVDRVRTVVAKRSGPEEHSPMTSVAEFGTRITDSADLEASCSIEWIEESTRAGGHVSHLGRAFERLGCAPTLVGTFGDPIAETFRDEYNEAELVSVGEPSTTDAIEFDDGKVMLSATGKLATLDWEYLESTVGREVLAECLDGTDALGIGYWSTIPRLPHIVAGIAEDLWPKLMDPPTHVLVDPGDVRRLSESARRGGLEPLATLDERVPVTISANGPESIELARMAGAQVASDSLVETAETVYDHLDVTRFVAHSASKAVAVTDDTTHAVTVPWCDEPVLTTSAGDHFNAGLLLAGLVGIDRGAALIVANSLAGFFVRTGTPPTYEELCAFVTEYDDLDRA